MLMVVVFWSCIMPPMTMVLPLRIATRLWAERLAITGAETPAPMGTVVPVNWLISGATSSVTIPSGLMCGVTFKMMPTAWYVIVLICWPVMLICVLVMNGHFLADGDARLLVVAGKNIRAGKNVELAFVGQGMKRGVEMRLPSG